MIARRRTTAIAEVPGTVAGGVHFAVAAARSDPTERQHRGCALHQLAENGEARKLGFDGLMACIYWTRTVQYFGHRHFDMAHTYNELAPLLEITTALDPHLLPAYEFGASFLAPKPPNGAGEPVRAIQLMEYGIEHNPDNWRLYLRPRLRLLHRTQRLPERCRSI